MKHISVFLSALFFTRMIVAAGEVETIENGKSPDAQFEVVNVLLIKMDGAVPYNERHFEIRNRSGETIISQGKNVFGASGAIMVLWRKDSRLVAISFHTSKFDVHTRVFFRDSQKLKEVEIPEYEPGDDSVYRDPFRWLKDGDLVLDITLGHHTKSEPPVLGYYATVHFSGDPPKASKNSQTKTIDRDQASR